MLPAQAGVILSRVNPAAFHGYAPRAGGGDPAVCKELYSGVAMLPAQAGVIPWP